jgi:hypothetical protein
VRPLDDDRSPAPDLERLTRAVAQGELDPGPESAAGRPG